VLRSLRAMLFAITIALVNAFWVSLCLHGHAAVTRATTFPD